MNEEHDGGENEGHQRAGGGDDVNFVEQVRFPGSAGWVGGRWTDGRVRAGQSSTDQKGCKPKATRLIAMSTENTSVKMAWVNTRTWVCAVVSAVKVCLGIVWSPATFECRRLHVPRDQ